MGRARVLQEVRNMRFEDVYGRFQGGRLSCEEAADVLGVSLSTFERYRRRDAQIGTRFSPNIGRIGVGQGLGLVLKEQHDVSRQGLLLQELHPQPGPVNRLRILPTTQRVPREPAPEAPFFRIPR